MTVDLAGLIEAQEGLMADACKITSNPGGTADDVLDPTTFDLVPATPAPVYTGPCTIARDRRQLPPTGIPTDAADYTVGYVLKLPLTLLTVEPQPGDRVTCTASLNDQGLVTKVFRIVEIERDGYATSRICRLATSWASS